MISTFLDLDKTSADTKENRELLAQFRNEIFESAAAYASAGGNAGLAMYALTSAAFNLGFSAGIRDPLDLTIHLLNCAAVELGALNKETAQATSLNTSNDGV